MASTTSSTFLVLLLVFALLSELCWARPFATSNSSSRRRRRRNVSSQDVKFKIKGVERGMLQISDSLGGRLVARDWDADLGEEEEDKIWFAFCDDRDVIDEIGHVGVGMQICQADSTYKKAVYDRVTGDIYVRTPRPGDVLLEVVIYDHQKLYIRPSGSEREILVAQLEGSQGLARAGATAVHEHLHRVHPVHLADIEDQLDRYARWEIKVHRPGL